MFKFLLLLLLALAMMTAGNARDLDERTNHVFGFIKTQDRIDGSAQERYLPIVDANQIPTEDQITKPERNVNGENIEPGYHELKITLDRLEVSGYPGWGILNLLFVFSAQDQMAIEGQSLDKAQFETISKSLEILNGGPTDVPDELKKVLDLQQIFSGSQNVSQPVKYTHLYQIREGDGLGVNGYPIFVGLRSGEEGPAFRISIYNIRNDDDLDLVQKITDKVSKGLNLGGVAGNILSVVTGQVEGMVEHLKERSENKLVQDVFLGLDHSSVATRAKLAQGSYVIAQIDHDPTLWDWNDWTYDTQNGQVVRAYAKQTEAQKARTKAPKMDYNYFVIGVSKMTPRPAPKPHLSDEVTLEHAGYK